MTISFKKIELAREEVFASCGCGKGCGKCSGKLKFVDKMAEAHIPVMYWTLKMSDFSGAKNIKDSIIGYTTDLDRHYKNGTNVCLSGTLGTGKTYGLTNILKAALSSGYVAYYTTLSEMVHELTSNLTKFSTNQVLLQADFLAIDEVDSRHIAQSDAAQDFYGTIFERILRSRLQNRLPTLLATNNSNLEDAFGKQFRKIIESLSASCMMVVPALGQDYRIVGDKNGT